MKKWIFYSLMGLFATVFVVAATMLILYFTASKKQEKVYNELSDIHQQAIAEAPEIPVAPDGTPNPESIWVTVTHPDTGEQKQILPEFVQLYAMNPDIVGWITIPGTKIDYPVMQTPQSPDYYLKRNFHKEKASHGAIYAREQCDFLTPSDNVTIYGHRMKDGSMFADLSSYTQKNFWESHKTIELSTLQNWYTYEIFAVFQTTASIDKGFKYHNFVDAIVAEEFDEFVRKCQELSFYDTGIIPQYGDKLITLSTCEYSQTNGRLVVVARRID